LAFAFAKPNVLDRAVGFQHVAQRLAVWLVADFVARHCQATIKFEASHSR